ncbi:MAG: hypothetical protein PHF21_05000, partial [Bacilli bacterium]|nr:hypothetical protein [Bacilli bacterium]
MKKEIKIIITLVIGLLMFGTKVSAAGKGICYDLPMLSGGYCQLKNPVNIYGKIFTKRPLLLSDGTDHTKYGYFGVIDGKNEDLFCIDSNLSQPGSTPYKYARPFNINEDYDRAIAKIYAMFVNDTAWLMQSRGISFKEASLDYIQITNIAMRAITKKYNYDIAGGYRENIFKNVYNQFEGKTASTPKLKEGTDAYKLAQKYYCSGLLSCKNCSSSIIDSAAKSFCTNLSGVSTSDITEFKFSFKVDPDEIEDIEKDSEEFEKIVPVKISGLELMMIGYSTYKHTNPSFMITKISCKDNKPSCTPVDPNLYNKNLLLDSPGKDYVIKVKVTGKKSDFKTESNSQINIEYKSTHIRDTNNLAVLRYRLSDQTKQRMIALMASRVQKGDANVKINTPSMCEVRDENGETKYYYGGTLQTPKSYLEKGCCNVDLSLIDDEDTKELYLETCATEDVVILETKCDNDRNPDNMSESSVLQKPIDKIMNIVNNAENNQSYSLQQVKDQLKNTDNNRDDYYIYNSTETDNTVVSSGNDYCKMYTSENLLIAYPGTVEATSGRFFVFDNGEQPRVEGSIVGNFHTDYNRWKKDYEDAIEAEKVAYTDWQIALAVENALAKAETEISCYSSGTCGCCNVKYVDGVPSCTGSCYTSYSGSDDRYADSETYFTADGVDLKYIKARKSCGCDNDGTVSSTTSPKDSSSRLENTYTQAVRDREKLEKYKKDECEKKSNISTHWKYYLEPDLTFTYKQEYYDSKTDKVVETKSEVEFKVSKK